MRLFEVKYNYPTSYPYVVVVNHKFWFKVFLDHVHKNFYKKVWNKYQALDVDEIKVTCDEMYNRCVVSGIGWVNAQAYALVIS